MNNRRGKPPGFNKVHSEVLEQEVRDTEVPNSDKNVEELVNLDSTAFTMVRSGKTYQLVRIEFDKEKLVAGKPEIMSESTDRWYIQAQLEQTLAEVILENEDF